MLAVLDNKVRGWTEANAEDEDFDSGFSWVGHDDIWNDAEEDALRRLEGIRMRQLQLQAV